MATATTTPMDTPDPADITTALTSKHEEYEGEPMTQETLHEALVDMATWTVDTAMKNGESPHRIVDSVKNLALAAAMIPGYDKTVCDACDAEYDVAVLEAADKIIPSSSTQNDSNGDPDVTVCGICIAEHEDEPIPEPDPVTDAEWATIIRAEEDDVRVDVA